MIPFPYSLIAGAVALAAAFGAGWVGHVRYRAGVDAVEALAQAETNRESERLAARNMQRVSDALTKDRIASDRRAADLAGRLRQLSESGASSPTVIACRDDDSATAARVLPPDIGRDLVKAMESCEAVASSLRGFQAMNSDADQ